MIDQLKHSYSDGIHNKKVAVLGNYPPPLGGVSVHIQRVMHKLVRQGNAVHHFDTSTRSNVIRYTVRLLYFLYASNADYVIYHTVDLNSRLIEFTLLTFMKKLLGFTFIIVEHNCRHMYTRTSVYKRRFGKLLHYVDHVVLIGHATQKSYHENAICIPLRTSVEAAFLPPDQTKEHAILATYPSQLLEFLSSHAYIITANAYQLTLLDGKDLYGFDQCIELAYRLKKDTLDIGLVLVLGNKGNELQYEALLERIKQYELEKDIFFLFGQKELWPLIKRSTFFVRPTLSDAESVSVQEALYFKVPVIASDVCVRPANVMTFKTGNVEDFYATVNNYRNHLHAQ